MEKVTSKEKEVKFRYREDSPVQIQRRQYSPVQSKAVQSRNDRKAREETEEREEILVI